MRKLHYTSGALKCSRPMSRNVKAVSCASIVPVSIVPAGP